eukprot:8815765-Pyramimonas_sp.AAC.1
MICVRGGAPSPERLHVFTLAPASAANPRALPDGSPSRLRPRGASGRAWCETDPRQAARRARHAGKPAAPMVQNAPWLNRYPHASSHNLRAQGWCT